MNKPILCEGCQSKSPLQFLQLPDTACFTCTRPFTPISFPPRQTFICSTCSRARNCCQSCLKDLLFLCNEKIKDFLVEKLQVPVGKREDVVRNAQSVQGKIYNADALDARPTRELTTLDSLTNEEITEIREKLVSYLNNGIKKNLKSMKSVKIDKEVASEIKSLPFNAGIDPKNQNGREFFLFGIFQLPIFSIQNKIKEITGHTAIVITRAESGIGFAQFESENAAREAATVLHSLGGFITVDLLEVGICWSKGVHGFNLPPRQVRAIVERKIADLKKLNIPNLKRKAVAAASL